MWTSKLGNQYLKTEVEAQHQANMLVLRKLRQRPDNRRCADCGTTGAEANAWAIVNFGAFVCTACASAHRVRADVSKVKGLSGTYLWGADEVSAMSGGNEHVDRSLMQNCASASRLACGASHQERVVFVERKYCQQLWKGDQTELRSPVQPAVSVEAVSIAAAKPVAVGCTTDDWFEGW
mmetsp:Transcript_90359/g.242016  ORF Transcript_90359/g.242016 Transcript_90359/m.242016 type:complete len:179 (-) Transcript_90359:87-623(-)